MTPEHQKCLLIKYLAWSQYQHVLAHILRGGEVLCEFLGGGVPLNSEIKLLFYTRSCLATGCNPVLDYSVNTKNPYPIPDWQVSIPILDQILHSSDQFPPPPQRKKSVFYTLPKGLQGRKMLALGRS